MKALSKILNCMKIQFEFLIRKKIFYIGFPLYLILTTYIFYYTTILWRDVYQGLLRANFYIQVGIFVFMIIGYSSIKMEQDNECEEVIYSLPNGKIYNIVSKFIFNLILITIFVFISMGIIFVFYSIKNLNVSFYIESMWYFIFYWEGPFVISLLIGMIIGLFVKSKVAYAIMFFVTILIGPLNHEVFRVIMQLMNVDLRNLEYMLNVGQAFDTNMYNCFRGLPLQKFNFIIRFLIIIGLIYTFVVLFWRKNKKIIISSTLIFLMIFMPCIYEYISDFHIVKLYAYSEKEEKYDVDYYENYRRTTYKDISKFEIESCHIKLQTKHGINVSAKMNLKFKETGNKILFTLYRNLHVRSVKDGNGENLQFNQKGDRVEVIFNDNISIDTEKIITFDYGGTTSPLFLADGESLLLPSYFPYIPSNIEKEPMFLGNILYRNDLSYVADYTLEYDGKLKIYTNLDKVSENKWEGKQVKGITILSGKLQEKKYKDISIYYPVNCKNNYNQIQECVNMCNKSMQVVKEKYDKNFNSKIKKVFFIPIPKEMYGLFDDVYVGDGTVLYSYQGGTTAIDLVAAILNNILFQKNYNGEVREANSLIIKFINESRTSRTSNIEEKFNTMIEIFRGWENGKDEKANLNNKYMANIYTKVRDVYVNKKEEFEDILIKLYHKISNEPMNIKELSEYLDGGQWENE